MLVVSPDHWNVRRGWVGKLRGSSLTLQPPLCTGLCVAYCMIVCLLPFIRSADEHKIGKTTAAVGKRGWSLTILL